MFNSPWKETDLFISRIYKKKIKYDIFIVYVYEHNIVL